MSNKTKDWELYEAGKQYNSRLKPNYYDTVDTNIAFFNGDQWRNVQSNGLPTPVFNIIKRVIQFFVASMTSSNTQINFEPLLYADANPTAQMNIELEACDVINAAVKNLLEKFKFEYKMRKVYFKSAITGDVAAHMYFNMKKKPYGGAYSSIKGEICMELVNGSQVYFGNANNPSVEEQPYIIIEGRELAKNLQEEAKMFMKNNGNPEQIKEDSNYQQFAGDAGKIEVNADGYGKATYIIIYKMENETIKASKCVENAYIYKDIDTGLTRYPLAWNVWEDQENQYHGRALSTGMIPNQIFINKMFAMVMYHLMRTAFPKAVYDSDKIPTWTDEIGMAIPVNNLQPGDNIKNIAGYLDVGHMSDQIVKVIELAMQYTKETLGISDAALGNIDPENKGAIIAVQKSNAIPLENPKANAYSFVEDIGYILIDMIGTYYGTRPVVIEKEVQVPSEDGITPPETKRQKFIMEYDFSKLKDMWLKVKTDVGESSYWSEIAATQTLDNLLNAGFLDIIDYLERIDDEKIPMKQALISKLKEKQAAMVKTQQLQMNNPNQPLAAM